MATLVYILHLISYAAIGIAIADAPFLLYYWIQYTAAKRTETASAGVIPAVFPRKSVGVFVGAVLTGIICGALITYFGRDASLDFLNSLPDDYTVTINETNPGNPKQVVAELKKVGNIMAQHSHPTNMIRVEIHSSNGDLILDLGRDSDDSNEYWVFNPSFDKMNEIGRIRTPIFSNY